MERTLITIPRFLRCLFFLLPTSVLRVVSYAALHLFIHCVSAAELSCVKKSTPNVEDFGAHFVGIGKVAYVYCVSQPNTLVLDARNIHKHIQHYSQDEEGASTQLSVVGLYMTVVTY